MIWYFMDFNLPGVQGHIQDNIKVGGGVIPPPPARAERGGAKLKPLTQFKSAFKSLLLMKNKQKADLWLIRFENIRPGQFQLFSFR